MPEGRLQMSDNTTDTIRQALERVPEGWSQDERLPSIVKYCNGTYEIARASSFIFAQFIARTPEWLHYLLAQLDAKDTEIAAIKASMGYGAILMLRERAEQAEALRGELEALRNDPPGAKASQDLISFLVRQIAAKDKVLEWYGDESNYRPMINANVSRDLGLRARTVLSNYRKEEIDG